MSTADDIAEVERSIALLEEQVNLLEGQRAALKAQQAAVQSQISMRVHHLTILREQQRLSEKLGAAVRIVPAGIASGESVGTPGA